MPGGQPKFAADSAPRTPYSALASLPFAQFSFRLVPREPLYMPARNKGNVLRGALGVMLGRVFASQPESLALYHQIFEPAPPPDAPALSKNAALPRRARSS